MSGHTDSKSWNIPGLVAKQTDTKVNPITGNTKFQENVLTWMPEDNNQNLNHYIGGVDPVTGSITTSNGINYTSPQELENQLKTFIDMRKEYEKYQPLVAPRPYAKPMEDWNYLQNYMDQKKKSALEELIDELFTIIEKWDFLVSLGYVRDGQNVPPTPSMMIHKKSLESPDAIQEPSYTLEKAFLREMVIKFKNVLLTKGTLKLKI